jgi:hypothetical protein
MREINERQKENKYSEKKLKDEPSSKETLADN